MSADAAKRLEVIESFEDLGAGFVLALTTWRSAAPGTCSARVRAG